VEEGQKDVLVVRYDTLIRQGPGVANIPPMWSCTARVRHGSKNWCIYDLEGVVLDVDDLRRQEKRGKCKIS
jgi:hypothetical protein